jgi:uncharacterized protein (DUF427 family)
MGTVPEWARRSRTAWRYHGQERPPFAVVPAQGQESVWDYPRPPKLAPDRRLIEVRSGATLIARSHDAVRVLETASPPTFYLPPSDVRRDLMTPANGSSWCEWKGEARYWTVTLPESTLEAVAWSYPDPFPEFEAIRDYVSFYPARLECYVGSHRAGPQSGGFYGGWVTPEVVGPFKGDRDSAGW